MEQHLPGGFVTTVVRAGDTVRRRPSPNAAFVHDLLRFLEDRGWDGRRGSSASTSRAARS